MGDKIIIDLTPMESDYFGIIIIEKTGIIWTNQTSGTMCHHPEIEGFFIPVPIVHRPIN